MEDVANEEDDAACDMKKELSGSKLRSVWMAATRTQVLKQRRRSWRKAHENILVH